MKGDELIVMNIFRKMNFTSTENSELIGKLRIHPQYCDALIGYDIEHDDRILELLRSGRLKMEIVPPNSSPSEYLKSMTLILFTTIDPTNAIAKIVDVDVSTMKVRAAINEDTYDRISSICANQNEPQEVWALPRMLVNAETGRCTRLVTFDLLFTKKES